jgi:SAM-dependent methyltransferase
VTAPRLYGEFADWYYLVTHPDDYEEEAGIFHATFQEHTRIPIRTMLELGSGGGANALYLKRHYELTLTDLSERMLAQSKTINPGLRHVVGDMRSIRLGEVFDAVFVHDAVAYMTSEADLGAAIVTAAAHLKPGGMVLIVPDDVADTYEPREEQIGGHDIGDRSLRYVESHGPLREGSPVVEVHFSYTMREADGTERVADDVHQTGVFPRSTWMRLIEGAGLEALALPYVHSEVDRMMDMFVGFKPA